MILSAAMLLRHLNEHVAAAAVERAVDRTLQRGEARTPDLGGTSPTDDVAAAIAEAVAGWNGPGDPPAERRVRRAGRSACLRRVCDRRGGRDGRPRRAGGVPSDQRAAAGTVTLHARCSGWGCSRSARSSRPSRRCSAAGAWRSPACSSRSRSCGRTHRVGARRALAPGHDDRGRFRPRGHADGRSLVRLGPRHPAHRSRLGPHPLPARRLARAPWAVVALVAFARVYLGAHAPLDVLGGLGLGLVIGGSRTRPSAWRSGAGGSGPQPSALQLEGRRRRQSEST